MIDKVFKWVADLLTRWAERFGITYNTINIIVYYLIIPITWTLMIDYLIGWPVTTPLLVVTWVLIIIATWGRFQQWCDVAFKRSVDFLLWFKRLKWNYYKASVYICVAVPILIYAILIYLCIQKYYS